MDPSMAKACPSMANACEKSPGISIFKESNICFFLLCYSIAVYPYDPQEY